MGSTLREIYFQDMPVYRLEPTKYYDQRRKFVDEFVSESYRGFSPTPAQVKAFKERIEQMDYDKFGPWDFNEIIGYIRLHFLGSQVRGEYLALNQKRIVKSRKKVFIWQTWKLAPEISLPSGASNSDVLRCICEYVEDCRKELPRRYIDDQWLRKVGPFVDWLGLLKSS